MAEFKFFCPQCGQHIQCDTSYSGRQINCPVCQQAIVVPRADGATPVPVKSKTMRKILVIAASVAALAGLVIGGWYGYSRIRIYIKSGHLPSGVVALWSGGGNGKDSVGGNNGILMHGVSFETGKVGQAFVFDGASNYVEVADNASLHLTNALTIAFWAKRNAQGLHIIVEKGGDWTTGQNSFTVNLNDTYAGGIFAFNFTGGWRGCSVHPDFAWHHYAVVARNGQKDVTLYLDGAPQKITLRQGPSTVRLKTSALPLHIGAQIDPRFNYFSQTAIDDLSIFNRALSASEIQQIYRRQK